MVVGCVIIIKYPLVGLLLILLALCVYWIQKQTPQPAGPTLMPATTATESSPTPDPTTTPDPSTTLTPFSTPDPLSSSVPDFGECPMIEQEQRPSLVRATAPANTTSSVVDTDYEFKHPAVMDNQCINDWFPTFSFKDQQESEYKLHRVARRNQDGEASARWTDEDKAKYERARKAQEKDIAAALRPDQYMVVEQDALADYSEDSTQPFATLTSQDYMSFHNTRYRNMMGGGDLAALLQTQI